MGTGGYHLLYLAAGVATLSLLAASSMGFGRVFGRATTTFHHSKNSLILSTNSGKKIEFADLCKSILPRCRLNPFLFNGHLQTIWTTMEGQEAPVFYRRHVFESQEPLYPGIFSVDFVVPPYGGSDPSLPPRTTYFTEGQFANLASTDNRPMLVLLHGLSGGSHELYLRHVLAPLVSQEAGWEACVVNSRGCAMSKITTNLMYNARATWDVRQTVKWLRETFPNRPLFGIGFSLGANIITNVRIGSAMNNLSSRN
jgi:uncharacterized protein